MNAVLLTSNGSTVSGLLSLAGEVVTWLVAQMGVYLNFIVENPIILVPILIMLAGLGIGMLGRAAHAI